MPDHAELVALHGPIIWSLCRRLCPEPEDAYQEIWEKALGALPRFDPSGSATLRTWLVTIAHRHLVDRFRRRRVRGQVLQISDLAVPPEAEIGLDLARRRAVLEAALQRLPDPQRRVVVLHHLHGQSLQDIAATEGVAVGTVKSRLHRGRARLTELIQARLGPSLPHPARRSQR